MVNQLKLTLIIFGAFLALSCTFDGNTHMEKYEWRPTESAKAEYPMEILSGDVFYAGGGSIYIPDKRTVENGWGEIGSTHISGEDLKGVPTAFQIAWFSYIEDKFYAGKFELPSEKIRGLFEEGVIFHATDQRESYDTLVVGMGLQGEVAVWLSGAGVVTEVALYKAEEASLPWTDVLDNEDISRQEYIQMVLDESMTEQQLALSMERVQLPHYWARFKDVYNTTILVSGTSKPQRAFLKSLNGEHEYLNLSTADDAYPRVRSAPQKMTVITDMSNGDTYEYKILFDEDEIVGIFNQLHTENPVSEFQILIEIEDETKHAAAYIVSDNYKVAVEKAEVSANVL